MTTPTPTPAEMPRAGLRHLDATALRFAQANVELSRAAPGELERLAAEQGVSPVTNLDDLAAPLRDRLTDDELDAFHAALHDPAPGPPPTATWTPHPAALMPPHRATMPVITRDQHIRRLGLELAVRFYTQADDLDDAQCLATAKTWAAWIRSGTELVSDTTTPDSQPGRP